MRDILMAMRDVLKLSKRSIFRINLFLTNVKADLTSRGNKQLADIKVILRKVNLFSSTLEYERPYQGWICFLRAQYLIVISCKN